MLEQLTATNQRPLFSPERRQPPVVPAVVQVALPPAPTPPPEPPRVALLGVIVDGNGPRAVVRSEADGKYRAVWLGDEIGGWKVTAIEGRQVVISLDNREMAVKLFAGDHGGQAIPVVHQPERVLEVNAAGVLRSHRVQHNH